MFTIIPFLVLQLACSDPVTTSTSVTETSETTVTTETVTSTGTTTTSTTETAVPIDWSAWQIVEEDTVTYGESDYTLQTWEVGPEWPNYFQTKMGTDRRFYLLKPIKTDPSKVLDTITMFHGGVVANDGDPDYYDPKDPFDNYCGAQRDLAFISTSAAKSFVPHFAIDRGMAMVFPENLWCDFWIGKGPDDLSDVTHRSYEHVEEIMEFMDAGQAGFQVGTKIAWGSSAGGVGALMTAHWYDGGVDAVVVDSAPCNMLEYYQYDKNAMKHIFGLEPFDAKGKPTDAHDNYLNHSCNYLVSDLNFRTPVFFAYNTYDFLTSIEITSSLQDALDTSYPLSDIQYEAIDFYHHAPGVTMHGQTRSAQQPLWYTTGIVFDWMGGKNILFHEAEGSCEHAKSTCSVGLHIYEDEFQPWANHSHGGGIQVSPSMGPGILFDDYLPAEVAALPDGHEITAMAVIELTSKPMSPETIVGSLSYLDDSGNITKEWLGSDLFAELMLPQDAANGLKQYYATQITFTKGANGRLFVATEGEIEFMLDAIVFQY